MRITLCAINSKFVHSTLAVWYLKAAAKENAACQVVEGTINEKVEQIYNRIIDSQPEMVAFSTYIWNVEMVLELSKKLKTKYWKWSKKWLPTYLSPVLLSMQAVTA